MKRYVTATEKGFNHDITVLCNKGQHWSPRSKADAIIDIQEGSFSYWVRWEDGEETEVRVVDLNTGDAPHLRTDKDVTKGINDLENLPDC